MRRIFLLLFLIFFSNTTMIQEVNGGMETNANDCHWCGARLGSRSALESHVCANHMRGDPHCQGGGGGGSQVNHQQDLINAVAVVGMAQQLFNLANSMKRTYVPLTTSGLRMGTIDFKNPAYQQAMSQWKAEQMNPSQAKPYFERLLQMSQGNAGWESPIDSAGRFDDLALQIAKDPKRWAEALYLLEEAEGLLGAEWERELTTSRAELRPRSPVRVTAEPVDFNGDSTAILIKDGIPTIEPMSIKAPTPCKPPPPLSKEHVGKLLVEADETKRWREENPVLADIRDTTVDFFTNTDNIWHKSTAQTVALAIKVEPTGLAEPAFRTFMGDYQGAAGAVVDNLTMKGVGKAAGKVVDAAGGNFFALTGNEATNFVEFSDSVIYEPMEALGF